jgi:hypothetical protein
MTFSCSISFSRHNHVSGRDPSLSGVGNDSLQMGFLLMSAEEEAGRAGQGRAGGPGGGGQ